LNIAMGRIVGGFAVVALLCVAPHAGQATSPVPAGLKCLVESYPKQLCEARADALVWCDGTVMPWDDGAERVGLEAMLAGADLKDQMSMPYTPGPISAAPPVDFDPGRVRYDPLFRKMYGGSAAAVREQTALITWMPKTANKKLRMTTVNGVHKKLEAVGRALDELPEPMRKIAANDSGTFVWRKIKGTDRVSMHSYAIAIDVGVPQSDYWGWVKPGADGLLPWRNRIPWEIAQVFEAHGFIWGAKWYHFDTMHFEYRPELLHPACAGAAKAVAP
jgi:peptidoglycan L-alanyl-D-glutamate endopeptidase CwlK